MTFDGAIFRMSLSSGWSHAPPLDLSLCATGTANPYREIVKKIRFPIANQLAARQAVRAKCIGRLSISIGFGRANLPTTSFTDRVST